jgi:MFS family permease
MKKALNKFFGEAVVSLQYRNMKLYCGAAMISLLGSMMQETMIAWVAYELTGSTAVLGNIMSWFMLPMIVASIPGGWVADRFDRKRIVLLTQGVALLVALSYAFMATTGALSITAVYALSAVLGVTVAFEMSSRMAMLPQLVDKPEHIGNAFALDSLIFYSSRLLGPAVGALFLVVAGPAIGFFANAATYVYEIVLLSRLRPAPAFKDANKATLREAFVFAYGNPRRRRVLLLLAATTFFGVYIQLMPAFTAARDGSALMNGFLIFCSEIGAVIASMIIAQKTAGTAFVGKMRKGIGWAAVLFSVCICAFAMTTGVVWSLLLMIPTGFAMSAVFSGAQAVLQVEVDDRVRGAFTAMFYNFSYFGMLALGGATLGHVAEGVGLTATMVGAAGLCLLASLVYLVVDRPATAAAK